MNVIVIQDSTGIFELRSKSKYFSLSSLNKKETFTEMDWATLQLTADFRKLHTYLANGPFETKQHFTNLWTGSNSLRIAPGNHYKIVKKNPLERVCSIYLLFCCCFKIRFWVLTYFCSVTQKENVSEIWSNIIQCHLRDNFWFETSCQN